jgi:hypothetical protein
MKDYNFSAGEENLLHNLFQSSLSADLTIWKYTLIL